MRFSWKSAVCVLVVVALWAMSASPAQAFGKRRCGKGTACSSTVNQSVMTVESKATTVTTTATQGTATAQAKPAPVAKAAGATAAVVGKTADVAATVLTAPFRVLSNCPSGGCPQGKEVMTYRVRGRVVR